MHDHATQLVTKNRGIHQLVEPDCVGAVHREVTAMLRARTDATTMNSLAPQLGGVARRAAEDLMALTRRDPASLGCWRYVLDSYSAFHAVLSHRLASAVHRRARGHDPVYARTLLTLARRISEDAKVSTGVEIHPAATIGPRLVIDHGIGTVIGETTTIGADSYILQGVILGATRIALNPTGKRHPTLGSRVEIGANARVLGPVQIGDDVFIGPGAIVTTGVPNGARVRLINQYQMSHPTSRSTVFGVVPMNAWDFQIHGTALAGVRVALVQASDRATARPFVDVLQTSENSVICRIKGTVGPVDELVKITDPFGTEFVIIALDDVWRYMCTLRKRRTIAP